MTIIDREKKLYSEDGSCHVTGLKDIPIGTYFTGRINDYTDNLFLRTYTGVISISNPNHTWEYPDIFYYKQVNVNIYVV